MREGLAWSQIDLFRPASDLSSNGTRLHFQWLELT